MFIAAELPAFQNGWLAWRIMFYSSRENTKEVVFSFDSEINTQY